MITPVQSSSGVTVEGVEESMAYVLDSAATAHILNMLRSGTYKDPKMACIREYWCNARDSVVEAGKDPSKYVFISLPNSYEPYLKIRDEGVGMSEADFKRVFRKYGASTKRDSNETIGCLGIGSKSAFSYSDTYTVTAIKNGWKRVFIASVARNSTGADGIGSLNRVVEVETDEPNGVEISIPVEEKDFHDFYTRVVHFMSFLPLNERPIVKGKGGSLIHISERVSYYANDNWKLTNSGRSYAIMGGVPYALDIRSMDLLAEEERQLVDIGVDIVFPIGSFEFTISREEVRYTELSQNAIKAELRKILGYLAGEISKKFAPAKSIWDAKFIHLTLSRDHSLEAKLIRHCLPEQANAVLSWNGHKITNNHFEIGSGTVFHCEMHDDEKVSRTKSNLFAVVTAEPATIVVHDTNKYGEWQRVRTIIRNQQAQLKQGFVILLKFDNTDAKDAFFKRYDFTGIEIANLSSFVRDRASAAARKTARTFEFDYQKTLSREDSWIPEECDFAAGGFYVEICHGLKPENCMNGQLLSNHKIQEMLEVLAKIGKPVDAVWGIRSSQIPKLDMHKWKNITRHFSVETQQHLLDNRVMSSDVNASAFYSVKTNAFFRITDSYAAYVVPNIKSDSLVAKYVELYKKAEGLTKGISAMSDIIDCYKEVGNSVQTISDIPADPIYDELLKLAEEVIARYPMLQFVSGLYSDKCKLVTEYINEKDA